MAIDSKDLSKKIYSATFSSFCQEISRFRLSYLIRTFEVNVDKDLKVNDEHDSKNDWLVVVFAHSKYFRLTIKIHYNDEAAQIFAQNCRGPDTPTLGITAINDFMREYGNQLIGAVKQSIEDQSGYAQVSCPLVTRGQDAKFFSPIPTASAFEEHWQLSALNQKIQCSIVLEFLDRNFMKEIFLPAFFDKDAIGDVEFF